MRESIQHIEQQWEGQEHQFLGYEHVYIHFIYSFAWDITKLSWDKLKYDLLHKTDEMVCEKGTGIKGWKLLRLHERTIWDKDERLGPTYQPNLVTTKRVLERSRSISHSATLLVPMNEYKGIALGKCRDDLSIHLSYTVRLFESGGATCTFVARLESKDTNFENIHCALHLAHNVDIGDEIHAVHSHLTNVYIKLPVSSGSDADHSLLPESTEQSSSFNAGYCSLHDLFRKLLKCPPEWAPTEACALWYDSEVLDLLHLDQDFQSPFLFTIAQVERNSFLRFRKHPTLDTAREIGSILCKLTLDNRYIIPDFLHISEDYLTNVLAYNKERRGLINLCLDRRLFFAISRRGALALTANFDDIPSYFVVPSLLNLCEILRARWHMGNIISARLDLAIDNIGQSSSENGEGADIRSPLDLMETMFKWRILAGAFLRDPVPFLFDGGSVIEIAEFAERLLWLDRLRDETARKFEFLDQLLRDYLNIERQRRLDSALGTDRH
jgi:hypothetical protein